MLVINRRRSLFFLLFSFFMQKGFPVLSEFGMVCFFPVIF